MLDWFNCQELKTSMSHDLTYFFVSYLLIKIMSVPVLHYFIELLSSWMAYVPITLNINAFEKFYEQ